jgi:hypothetical protein
VAGWGGGLYESESAELPVDTIRTPADSLSSEVSQIPIEQLVYVSERMGSVPSVHILIDSLGPLIVRNERYLEVARRLGMSRIRALVDPGSQSITSRSS